MVQHQQAADQLFGGGGEMGALMRSYDWSKTPFGAVEQWPQSLRSTLSICLNSRFPMAIYWGPDCWLLYNDAWRPIVGDKHPWSLGRPADEVWPEIWDDISPDFARVFATGEGVFYSDTLLVMRRFGYDEECFFDYTFNPIQGEGGKIDGILNVVSETTYRVLNDRRAQLLRELASRTGSAKTVDDACALMAEALKSGSADVPLALLYIVNADGKTAHLSGGSEVALGLPKTPDQVDLTVEDEVGGWPIASVAQTGQSRTIDDLVSHFGHLPGSPWPEPPQEAMVLPILVPGQAKAVGVLVAVANPRRRVDAVYRDFFEQIAGQIAAAIANARSHEEDRRRADKLAELDRAKTVFFSNVSHEFRTPLTLMLGPVEEALQETQDADQRQRLELVYRNALRLQKLVNTLLDFSRIEAGRIEASYEPTDLALMTTDLAGVFRSAVEQAGLRLTVDCPPLAAPAYVDRDMWEKIVLNLLSNALKFTFEGEIAVVLHGNADQIQLEVRDTGTGIPPEELPHIFERFHRVQGARGRTHEGSGIGLSLVQELVGLHGGTIEVTSQVDQGTCFTITMPAGSDHLPSDSINGPHTRLSTATGATPYLEEALRWHPTEPREPAPPAPSSTTTARILLADDNADMLDYVERLLSPQYTVETARDGRAAIAAIRRQRPDLVLTDVMMPEIDGFELLRQLRSDVQTQELPIILLSARAGEESRIEGLAAGADDYLTKPFSARELLAKVEAALKLAQLRQMAKTSLQRSEERSRLAIRVAQLGTWRYDLSTQLVELDERMQEIWGESATLLPLAQVIERVHPGDRERVASAVGAALEPSSSGAYEIDYRIVWNDGTERWIMASGQALFGGEGLARQVVELIGTALDITERKQTELLLAEQKHLLELVASGYPLENCLTAICLAVSQLNPLIRAGVLLSDAQQQQFIGAIAPDFPLSFRAAVEGLPINDLHIGTCAKAVDCGEPVTCIDVVTDDRWSAAWRDLCLAHGIRACHSTPLLDLEGRPVGSLMLCFDQARQPTPWEYQLADFGTQVARIAVERDRATLALRNSEYRYRTLFESMDQGFCACEMLFDDHGKPIDYRFLEVNPAFERLTELPGMLGKTALELIPDLDAFWIETYGRVVSMGESYQFERQSVISGRWFNIDAFAIGDPQSNRFAILLTDISDRKKAELERERFLAVGADLQVLTGSNGYFQWVSPAFERILGWTTQEMLSRPWVEFVHPDDVTISVGEANQGFAGSETMAFENRYRHKDGSYRWFLWNAQFYSDRQMLYGAAIDITDRKRTEANLRESEKRFRSMADNAPVMVWVTDSTGYCTYLSQSWYDFTGQTEATGLGSGWLDAVHPDDQETCSQIFLAANERQEAFRFEYRLLSKDGFYHWAIDAASPWFGADGEFKGYIGSVLDISDRKRIEESLRQRETELRLVTNSVPALIAFVDADQRYRFNNQGYEDWFSQSAKDLYGKHIREVVGDAAYEDVRPYVEQVLTGQQVTFERSIRFKDGNLRYLSATYVPRINDQGVVEGFVALINDLSDRRQAEEALIQSEERYRFLVESIPQLVWTADAEGVLLDANQRWCDFTGLTPEQVKTTGWQAVVHPDDISVLGQNWAIAQQQGSNYQAEGRMRRADGVYRWHLHQAVPLKTKRGRILKWFGTATDIEDQKQLEQQRSQLLQQEQAARAAAEAASRTKDEFLAVVSHELRSPLNPILGWATLLKNGTLDATKTQQALSVIERNAKLQTELIDDLLDVSRMLRGKLQISATPVNLATTIRAAIETVRLAADAKSIRIEAHLETDVGLVSGDATRLQQVVWNLLSNAVKFTPAGGQIDVHLVRGDANQAQIIVKDTGKGIVPEFLPLIFDYFRQADSATTRQFGGLGLGLAIVRHLVELHGGTIQAASLGENMGATFTVSLPTLAHQALAQPGLPLQQPSLSLPGTQILVVDDDDDTRTFITFLLEQAGAHVVAAASAQAGLAALKQAQPQVLVSDIGMPDMDGYMLMQQIRALPAEQGGQVPAIALTAYVRETDQEQSLAAGFQRHISKPVEPAALLRAIAELLQS
ncbi:MULTISPECIES: PAS domain S-box protein [Cyanophyceae]|uniref:histidine kinase n=1 Tax=Leptolyngbya subtilissima DQ-A4 TaxID=2933933 RepID=A0ABV0K4U8_9CYAN|nr:PAS domain S-box protein [Nodosilinea sp. FACHB-141]MBD2113545.1 PAS domain S-box protein [Nodosilinea sp. FACHB-141]